METGEKKGDISPDEVERIKAARIVHDKDLGQRGVDLAAMLFRPKTPPVTVDSLRVAGYVDNERAGF